MAKYSFFTFLFKNVQSNLCSLNGQEINEVTKILPNFCGGAQWNLIELILL